tara:strand:- start:1122 stop:1298 length:177 start_codon:yes stop_codon:yes gene_type:complete
MTNFKDMVKTVYGAIMSADEQKRLAEMQRLMNLQIKGTTGVNMSKKEVNRIKSKAPKY